MQPIHFYLPRKLEFGCGVIHACGNDLAAAGYKRVFILTAHATLQLTRSLRERLGEGNTCVYAEIDREPTIADFRRALEAARAFAPDAVVGLGGGSVLDVAKLVAAFFRNTQDVTETFGLDLLGSRSTFLACLPTSAGTGSEVSPNAILLDESDQLKKAVVSRFLVPDAAYVDPLLTVSAPAGVTAATGMDALTHCVEAYTNKFAHPMVDIYALEGIRLIGASLERAVANGSDIEAREKLALGSLYGGMCLGPVNTAAVHALAYPLGGDFHLAHGLSNALLLPSVMRFNLTCAPERYAEVARALGAPARASVAETALEGVNLVGELARRCGLPRTLREAGIPRDAIGRMAAGAMKVTRLLKNNPRQLSLADAESIYKEAYE